MLTISEQELQNIAPRVLEKKIKQKQTVQGGKAIRYACACKLLRGQKRKKASVQTALDCTYQCGSRMNGLSYSKFTYGLKQAGIDINRKMLAEMAVNDSEGFKTLAESCKDKIA